MDITLSGVFALIAICCLLYVFFARKSPTPTEPNTQPKNLISRLRDAIADDTPAVATPAPISDPPQPIHRTPHPPEPPSLQTVTRECRSAETHLRKAVEEAEACSIECGNLKTLADQIESARVALLHAEVASAAKSHDWNANRRHHAAEVAAAGPVQLVAPVAVHVTAAGE
jgi:hypothetical protein